MTTAFASLKLSAGVPGLLALHAHDGVPTPYRRLPSPWGALAVARGARLRVAGAAGRAAAEPRVTLHVAGGAWADCRPAPGGCGHLIAVLEPWTAAALARRGLDPDVKRDLAQLAGADDDEAALRRLEAEIGRLVPRDPDAELLALAMQLFEEAGAGAVSRRLGGSRALRDAFHREFGMTPKVWARLCRFSADLKQLHGRPWTGQDQQAPDHFDQSHRIREFRAWAGMTPVAYRTRVQGSARVWSVPLSPRAAPA